jgi:hypothetical protein
LNPGFRPAGKIPEILRANPGRGFRNPYAFLAIQARGDTLSGNVYGPRMIAQAATRVHYLEVFNGGERVIKTMKERPVDIQAIGESRSCDLRACSIGREARTYLDLRCIAAIDAKHIRASTKLWPAPRQMTVQTPRIAPVLKMANSRIMSI